MWWITLTSIIAAAAGCIYGIKKGAIAAWIFLFNVLFSAYIGIMFVAILGKYSASSLPNQWAKAGTLMLVALLAFVLLQVISIHLFSSRRYPDLPGKFELIAAPAFGAIAGYVAFWLIVYVFFITPAGQSEFIEQKSGGVNMTIKARTKVCFFCDTLRFFSLQENDRQTDKIYQWLETIPQKSKAKPAKRAKRTPQKAQTADPNSTEPNLPAEPNNFNHRAI